MEAIAQERKSVEIIRKIDRTTRRRARVPVFFEAGWRADTACVPLERCSRPACARLLRRARISSGSHSKTRPKIERASKPAIIATKSGTWQRGIANPDGPGCRASPWILSVSVVRECLGAVATGERPASARLAEPGPGNKKRPDLPIRPNVCLTNRSDSRSGSSSAPAAPV